MVMGDLPVETGVLVLGGGPGGYAAAFRAADLGLDVTLVDDGPGLGGLCLLHGCIPSKVLLQFAELILGSREAAERGLRFGPPEIDLAAMRAWKDDVVGRLQDGLEQLCEARGVQHVRGRGRFAGPNRLLLEDSEYSSVEFGHAIIATGSRPLLPPGIGLQADGRIMDASGALALQDIPGRLLVVGGGYVGIGLGTIYAALGSSVTLVEEAARLLPAADADLVEPLAQRLDGLFDGVYTGTRLVSAEADSDDVEVHFEGVSNEGSDDGPGDDSRRFDRVLIAVGRVPNTDDIGLDAAGLEVAQDGHIAVDAQRRTAVGHLFAVGDAVGGLQLAHEAMQEGRVAAEVIAGRAAAFSPRALPSVIYSDPEIAWCGLNEIEAEQRGIEVEVLRFPWKASGRAQAMGAISGMSKLLVEPESGRLLGMGAVGRGAGNLVAEAVLAIEMGALADDMALSIHPHPTLSETLAEAARQRLGGSTHLPPPPAKGGSDGS